MREPRYLSTSVLNGDGQMWVLGGYNDNNPKKATEYFRYTISWKPNIDGSKKNHFNFRYKPKGKGRWRKGKPLPADLRDSGIESHCSFALNKTHVFLAGGNYFFSKYNDIFFILKPKVEVSGKKDHLSHLPFVILALKIIVHWRAIVW